MFLEVEEGGQDQDEEAVKGVFIADLPLGWYTGCMIEYLLKKKKVKEREGERDGFVWHNFISTTLLIMCIGLCESTLFDNEEKF